jgi:hypothetical protein
MIWVESEAHKLSLVQDPDSPFFTTDCFEGHPSVFVRASRIGEIGLAELTELVPEGRLSRASARRARAWLATPASGGPPGP